MKTLLLSLFGMLALSTAAVADDFDHHGHYDVHCSARNLRGARFKAEGLSEFARDRHVWREVQDEAMDECQLTSLVCIAEGCHEHYHHE